LVLLVENRAASTITDRICFFVTEYAAAMVVTGQHNISVTEPE
jgi:hypothetical protein